MAATPAGGPTRRPLRLVEAVYAAAAESTTSADELKALLKRWLIDEEFEVACAEIVPILVGVGRDRELRVIQRFFTLSHVERDLLHMEAANQLRQTLAWLELAPETPEYRIAFAYFGVATRTAEP